MKGTSIFAKVIIAFALVALLCAGTIVAQETTGALRGAVTQQDDGAALPGVTVTATNLENGLERATQTDVSGNYSIKALPPGSYDVVALLEGFSTAKAEQVRVGLGGTTTANLPMSLGVSETITVTDTAPLVDTTTTVTGLSVNADELNSRVPVGREVTQVALLAPATTEGDSAFNGRTPGQSLASIGGASVAENSYQVNGLNITNFRNGLGSSVVPFEFLEEVQVKTGGYEAEFGRSTGGVINMVTKSGGNDFTANISAYFEPDSLREDKPNDGYTGDIFDWNELEEASSTEANVTVGGAIVKDRLFYYALYSFRDRETLICGETFCSNTVRDDPFFGGKLDFNLSASHRIEGTYFSDSQDFSGDDFAIDLDGSGNPSVGALLGPFLGERGGTNWIAKYTGIFGSNFVLSLQGGNNHFDRNDAALGDNCPWAYDSRGGGLTRIGCWGNATRGFAEDEREAYRLDADAFVGSHSIRGGLDQEVNTSLDATDYSGGVYYRYFDNGARFDEVSADTELVRVRVFQGGGEFDTETDAIYVQDSWEATSNLTVNLGIRFESYNNKNSLGESFIEVNDQTAPRLGVIWDPTGNGRSKVYGSFGRYHLPIASNTNIRLAGAELFTEDWHVNDPGGFNALGEPNGLGQLLEANVFGDGTVPDARTVRAEGIEPEYQDEWIVGFEQMVGEKWAFGARGIFREFGQVIEDLTIDEALGQPGAFCYVLANPGSDYNGFEDCDHDGNLNAVSFSAEELGYPTPERNYYAVELTGNRRFADGFMLNASYTWSHSYGNYEGYVRSDNGQDDAGLTTLYDFAGLLDNGYGNLPNDRRHNVKLFGAYQFDMGLQVGGQIQYRSGRPINAFGVHPTDPFSELYGAESFFDQGQAVNRGSRGTTDSVWFMNLTTKYDFEVGPANLSARIDIFNVLDNDSTTEVNELADQESGAVNTRYLAQTNTQNPRRVRFGLSLRF